MNKRKLIELIPCPHLDTHFMYALRSNYKQLMCRVRPEVKGITRGMSPCATLSSGNALDLNPNPLALSKFVKKMECSSGKWKILLEKWEIPLENWTYLCRI
jgi:hypothetical protein